MENLVLYTIAIVICCCQSGVYAYCNENPPDYIDEGKIGSNCGLCDDSQSPQLACTAGTTTCCQIHWYSKNIPLDQIEDRHRGKRGDFVSRAKYYTCAKRTCCKGYLSGSDCKVYGCGGEVDKEVRKQPPCYDKTQKVVKVKYVKTKVYSKCGFMGEMCTRYKMGSEYFYEYGAPYCAPGFTLRGSICIKDE